MRPRLLDLFCGAGGAAMGYHRAGFEVVGVDIKPQPNYPFRFIQDDALHALTSLLYHSGEGTYAGFDVIHASPPCQKFSRLQRFQGREHPDLIGPTRDLLNVTGLPYVIENLPEAPLRRDFLLCGSMFRLRADGFELRRHRAFETNFAPCLTPPCNHVLPAAPMEGHGPTAWFYGKYGRGFSNELRRQVMGTPWIAWDEIAQAIPPAYTELIGHHLMQNIKAREAA